MKLVFSPHPNWRRNFEFKSAYTNKDSTYTLDPKLTATPKSRLEFKVDPTIHKFTWPPAQVL